MQIACIESYLYGSKERHYRTLDAKALKEMNEKGEIKGCIMEGLFSYDIAVSNQAAELKGFEGRVAGDSDLLVWLNISVGNIAGKAIMASPVSSKGFGCRSKKHRYSCCRSY